MKKVKGRDLHFISQINKDGSGTTPLDEESLRILQDEPFVIMSLSLSKKTLIASGFNSFVVRFKNQGDNAATKEAERLVDLFYKGSLKKDYQQAIRDAVICVDEKISYLRDDGHPPEIELQQAVKNHLENEM